MTLWLAVVSIGAADGVEAARDRCSARGARVVAGNDVARVFSVRGNGRPVRRTWYGCLRGREPVRLTSDISPLEEDGTHVINLRFALGGGMVAWYQEESSTFGPGEFGATVQGQSLRRGGPKFIQELEDAGAVSALVARDDGAAAWISGGGGPEHYGEVDAIAPRAEAAVALDGGRGIDGSSLSIDAGGVHWTRHGLPRVAEPFRPMPPPPATGVAGPQTLDPGYGTCGALEPPVVNAELTTGRMARSSDGSTVVAGRQGLANGRLVITRVRPDGAIDTGFGNGGAAETPAPVPTGDVTGVAVQPDGKIVVVSGSALARFNADGSLDPGFGEGGWIADPVSGGAERLSAVTISDDGGVIVAGVQNDGVPGGAPDRPVVARYLPNGRLDPAFGTGGVVALDGRVYPWAVRAVGDKLIVAGGDFEFLLLRLNADGSLDTSFGDNGKTRESPPARGALRAFALLPDGHIVGVGDVSNVTGESLVGLARWDANGHIDRSFGTAGFVVDSAASSPTGVLAGAHGRLIVTTGYGLLAYGADGTRDASFGLQGFISSASRFISFGFERVELANGSITGAVAQDDGTLLIANSFVIERYVLDEPALAIVAGSARVCSIRIATQTLKQLLKPTRTMRHGRLRVRFRRLQPGGVRLRAVAVAGSREIPIGIASTFRSGAGEDAAEIKLSRKVNRLLRSEAQVDVVATAVGAEGGAEAKATRTLTR